MGEGPGGWKLVELHAERYRSLRHATVELGAFTLFIGANASGKSTILDALRFLGEAVRERNFKGPTFSRGGMINLAWKGSHASDVQLAVVVARGESRFEWRVRLMRKNHDFEVEEETVRETRQGAAPTLLLESRRGEGSWWSAEKGQIPLKQGPMSCALAAAAADASFRARDVAEFIEGWGFFDPNPFLLRKDWHNFESSGLDHFGRNLAETLYRLDADTRGRIREATQALIGLPKDIEPMLDDDQDRFYFRQQEPGLYYRVHQMGVSSGTLRILALMTALYAGAEAKVIGIEEPENYIHPGALSSLVGCLVSASEKTQLVVTTHSPLVLDALGDPSVVRVVARDENLGTTVEAADAASVRRALDASGFGLGEYYETRGFGD